MNFNLNYKSTIKKFKFSLILENRDLNDSERIVLTNIAEKNFIVEGEGVINARAILDKEINQEPIVYRKAFYNNDIHSIKNICNIVELQKENADIEVYNLFGKQIMAGKYNDWQTNFTKIKEEFVLIKYYKNKYNYCVEKKCLTF